MEIQDKAATKQSLQKGPRDMTQHRPSSGSMHTVATEAPISRNAVDMTKFFDKPVPLENHQASRAPLNKREHHGYEGANTPMSARSLNKAND